MMLIQPQPPKRSDYYYNDDYDDAMAAYRLKMEQWDMHQERLEDERKERAFYDTEDDE